MQVTDVAGVPHCCGCGVGLQAAALIQSLAWELPYATGVEQKRKKKKMNKMNKKKVVEDSQKGKCICYG